MADQSSSRSSPLKPKFTRVPKLAFERLNFGYSTNQGISPSSDDINSSFMAAPPPLTGLRVVELAGLAPGRSFEGLVAPHIGLP